MIPTKFQDNRPFDSGEETKNRFSIWPPWNPSWISDRNDFSYVWSTSRPDASYQVSSQLAFRFRRRSGHLGFLIGTILAILIYKSPLCFLPSLESIGLSVQKKKRKIYFQNGGHLRFLVETVLASFDLQVTPMLPIKFQVSWLFGSGEEAKNIFSRWSPWRPSWISYRNDFSCFWSTSHLDASYQVSSQLAFRFRRRSEKYIFKMTAMATTLDFRSEWF